MFLQIANGLLYAYGALIYDLGMIAYTYNKKHSEYCTIIFSLESQNERVSQATWLVPSSTGKSDTGAGRNMFSLS